MNAQVFLLSLVAMTSAGPVVPKADTINWAEVRKNVEEVNARSFATMDYVIEEAIRGNAEIGAEIKTYLDSKRPLAEVLFAQVLGEVDDHTLTEEGARIYFAIHEGFVSELRAELTDSVLKLPAINALNIVKRHEESLIVINTLAEEIYQLLRQ